ncbi:hypothetical protein UAJ10_04870 [Nitrospirillum sp. BR 11164]|uniref:hypothetical protein n=1 Tax=Nitrospirillum sp. BR 11164 TaxID=3104324 RepID=UPI002AFFB325|nr:hypothetical protein [Nitrospirillum sp. BR 11164]MEA1648349.1 hypothetical protein [Nitrospirillum sp. BR 11164]
MRTIKTFLVIMGVLIVAGFTFIGVEVWRRATDPNHPRAFGRHADTATPGTTTASALPPEALAPLLKLPEGSRIEAMTSVGSRLAVQVALPGGAQQIVLLEPSTGKVQIAVVTGTTSSDTPSSTGGVSEPNQTMRPQVPRTP